MLEKDILKKPDSEGHCLVGKLSREMFGMNDTPRGTCSVGNMALRSYIE